MSISAARSCARVVSDVFGRGHRATTLFARGVSGGYHVPSNPLFLTLLFIFRFISHVAAGEGGDGGGSDEHQYARWCALMVVRACSVVKCLRGTQARRSVLR